MNCLRMDTVLPVALGIKTIPAIPGAQAAVDATHTPAPVSVIGTRRRNSTVGVLIQSPDRHFVVHRGFPIYPGQTNPGPHETPSPGIIVRTFGDFDHTLKIIPNPDRDY